MTRITGPHEGLYIAARAQQIGGGWMGEARVFAERPATFNDRLPVAKLGGDHSNAPSELDAVDNAERVARDWITTRMRDFDLCLGGARRWPEASAFLGN